MQRLNTGQIVNNRYRIVSLISMGGFGAVYRAWDMNLNAPCALKLNIDPLPEGAQQFAREASLLANLRHANLPRVIDHFVISGEGQYLVMEFITGQDLQEKIDAAGGPLPEAQVLEWADQVLDALVYLHSQHPPVVHRDIKPANVRITTEGLAVLVDFGIAKVYDPLRKTTLGARATTPGFAPVEQYGQGHTDARSDIYSLGSTIYNTLTGQPPPESLALAGGMPLKPPRQINPAIQPATEAMILKAMHILPEKRYQTALEFKAALQAIDRPREMATLVLPQPASDETMKHPSYPATIAAPVSVPAYQPQPVAPPLPVQPVQPASPAAPAPRRRVGLLVAGGIAVVLLLVLCGVGVWLGVTGLANGQSLAGQEQLTLTVVEEAREHVRQTEAALRVMQGAQATLNARGSAQPAPTEVLPADTAPPDEATPTLAATDTVPPTAASLEPVVISDFDAYFFVPIPNGCKEDGVLCYKLNDDWKQTQYGIEAHLSSEEAVFIDPAWPNPYLVFWADYDIKKDANLDIGWDSTWQTVRNFTRTGYWKPESVDLAAYKGKEITFRFIAFITGYPQSKWFIENIQIVPDYTP